jgi:hypothetical protein
MLYWMSVDRRKIASPTALLLAMSPLLLNASLITSPTHPSHLADHTGIQIDREEASVRASLRAEVAAHPDDFLIFETESSAIRFIREHAWQAQRESEPRIVSRGVLGYWNGKTLVVLPTLSTISLR